MVKIIICSLLVLGVIIGSCTTESTISTRRGMLEPDKLSERSGFYQNETDEMVLEIQSDGKILFNHNNASSELKLELAAIADADSKLTNFKLDEYEPVNIYELIVTKQAGDNVLIKDDDAKNTILTKEGKPLTLSERVGLYELHTGLGGKMVYSLNIEEGGGVVKFEFSAKQGIPEYTEVVISPNGSDSIESSFVFNYNLFGTDTEYTCTFDRTTSTSATLTFTSDEVDETIVLTKFK